MMAFKNKEVQKIYHRQYYQANLEHCREKSRKHRAKKIKWFKDYKKTLKCLLCGEACFVCLEFHHTGNKEIDVSKAVQDAWSIERILLEIEKCDVLCANCHRKVHATLA